MPTSQTEFDCDTSPPFPGLSTRTGEAVFDAPTCSAAEPANEPCDVHACWPATWIAGLEVVDGATTSLRIGWLQPHEPPCDWFDDCVVAAELPEVAVEPTVFACVTEPSSPGLSTRIEPAVFEGSICFALDSAIAD